MSEDFWGYVVAMQEGCHRHRWLHGRGAAEHAQGRPHSQQHHPGQFPAVLRLRNKGSEKKGPFARVALDKPLKKLISVSFDLK